MEQVTMTKTCVFCDSKGPLSREHVFGQWLSKTGIDLTPKPHYKSFLNQTPQQIGKQPPFRQTVKNVCKSCNNGWMSRLEEIAQRVLAPIILDQSTTITVDDQPAIAMWTQKTALIAMLVSSEEERQNGYGLPPKLYHDLYKQRENLEPLQPSQFWIGKYSESQDSPAVRVVPMVVRRPNVPEPDMPEACLMTVIIGTLFLQCLLFIDETITIEMSSDLNFPQLWPSKYDIQWPSGQSFNNGKFIAVSNGVFLKSTVNNVTLAPWSVATKSPNIIFNTFPCGKHRYSYPALLYKLVLQGDRYVFVTHCKCEHYYLIQLEQNDERCKACGPANEIVTMYKALAGKEVIIEMEDGVHAFLAKQIKMSN